MLSVGIKPIMLSVIMLNVVMLSVVAPEQQMIKQAVREIDRQRKGGRDRQTNKQMDKLWDKVEKYEWQMDR